jgi:hypothetical protein
MTLAVTINTRTVGARVNLVRQLTDYSSTGAALPDTRPSGGRQ